MAEAVIFSLLAVMLGFALLALIPVHRTRTAATSAAYACAQFVSQALDQEAAIRQAEAIGRRAIAEVWSGTPGDGYVVQAWRSGGEGG